jgi:orotate phosphoribosyltransferase
MTDWTFTGKETLANGLLSIGAVELRPDTPFTWSSGWKSPIYCDNRLVLSYPVLRNIVMEGFTEVIEILFPSVEVIVGTATAGIPHASMLADRLGLPTAYVRGSAKEHGKQKRTEGKLYAGAHAVVIEDTLSTGKSAYSAIDALRAEGVVVDAVLTILSYEFAVATEKARESGVPAISLVHYEDIIQAGVQSGRVSEGDVARLLTWREAPEQFV